MSKRRKSFECKMAKIARDTARIFKPSDPIAMPVLDYETMQKEILSLRTEVERLKTENIQLLSVAGMEHVTRTLGQADLFVLRADLDRHRRALDHAKAIIKITGDTYQTVEEKIEEIDRILEGK